MDGFDPLPVLHLGVGKRLIRHAWNVEIACSIHATQTISHEAVMQTWKDLSFFRTPKFHGIIDFLKEETRQGKEIYPPLINLLDAFVYCPFEEVKVVIVGQDPYHSPGMAHGLAFSVNPEVGSLPPSLQNIFKELVNDIGCPYPKNGCLIPWAKQGVLLLNASLSVEQGKANSHRELGWNELVKETLTAIIREKEHVVFICWGMEARQTIYRSMIDGQFALHHKGIYSTHPSPFSADKGFFGSRPFSKANKYLTEHGQEPIDWCLGG